MKVGEINYYTHSSKTNCVFVDNKKLPLISIDIWCKAGSSFDDVGKNGTAHFLEHMIFKGSNTIMPGEFDHKIESLGGISNASTGYDDVHYYVLIPPHNFRESLALLTNIVLNPEFNPNEFNKEKRVVIDEIKQQNDQPDEKLFNYFLKRVWRNNIYSKSILGSEESVLKLGIQDLEKFHRNHYTSEKICIAIAGNLSKHIYQDFEKSNLSAFNKKGFFNQSSFSQHKNYKSISLGRTGREEINFDKIEFSRIFMAWNIPSQNYQKYIIGLEILASILTVGRNSRLVKVLKEEKNLVESIYVDINSGEFGGLLIIEACCENENLKIAEKKINEIIEGILDYKNLNKDEIKKAINIVKSNYFFNLETSTQLTSFYGNELLWGRKYSMKKIEGYFKYWNNLKNFKEIIKFLSKDKFTLIATPK